MTLLTPSDPFEPPSLLHLFFSSPPKFLLRLLHRVILWLRPKAAIHSTTPIRVVCISDTHCNVPIHIPDGDMLVHAGDLTNAGTPDEIQAQLDWLNTLPHKHIVAISGNHDSYFDPRSRSTLRKSELAHQHLHWGKVQYLQHSSTVLNFPSRGDRKLHVYGAPQIPACGGPEHAFQYPRGTDAWSGTVPRNTDILVTHTPPKHHMDLPVGLGCEFLLKETWRIRPRLHVFGHVHAGRGQEVAYWDEAQRTFERACERGDGLIVSVLDPFLWFDIIKIAWHGSSSLLWERVWGGEDRATLLVNASLMYNNTGKLRNPPQVVDI